MATRLSNQLERSAQFLCPKQLIRLERIISPGIPIVPLRAFYPNLTMMHDGGSFFPPNDASPPRNKMIRTSGEGPTDVSQKSIVS